MKYKLKEEPIVVMPDIVSNEYFSVQSLKRAVWQYLIDHSRIVRQDLVKFHFILPSEDEFWKRVWARDVGKFKRKEIFDFQNEMRKQENRVKEAFETRTKYYEMISKNNQWEARIKKHEQNGTLYEKVLLKIARNLRKIGREITNKVVIK